MRYRIVLYIVWLVFTLVGPVPAALSLTAEDVLALKKAGVSDETIRVMIQQEKDGKRPAADHPLGKREIRDHQGVGSIEYSTGPGKPSADVATQQDVERAWEMLRHLIVDTRKTH